MKTINIEFENESATNLQVIIEPPADEFLLKSKDIIKVFCESLEDITLISSTFVNHETVII